MGALLFKSDYDVVVNLTQCVGETVSISSSVNNTPLDEILDPSISFHSLSWPIRLVAHASHTNVYYKADLNITTAPN